MPYRTLSQIPDFVPASQANHEVDSEPHYETDFEAYYEADNHEATDEAYYGAGCWSGYEADQEPSDIYSGLSRQPSYESISEAGYEQTQPRSTQEASCETYWQSRNMLGYETAYEAEDEAGYEPSDGDNDEPAMEWDDQTSPLSHIMPDEIPASISGGSMTTDMAIRVGGPFMAKMPARTTEVDETDELARVFDQYHHHLTGDIAEILRVCDVDFQQIKLCGRVCIYDDVLQCPVPTVLILARRDVIDHKWRSAARRILIYLHSHGIYVSVEIADPLPFDKDWEFFFSKSNELVRQRVRRDENTVSNNSR